MQLQLKKTADGSTTLYVPDLDEHYHSIFGAIQEAMHIYINAGLLQLADSQNRVLEIGFGTGLNALLTCQVAHQQKKHIVYHSIEKYPLQEKWFSQLDFGEEHQKLLTDLHQAEWEKAVVISPYFTLQKIQQDLKEYSFSEQYDLIYYDAFAPDKQPEMWSKSILEKVTNRLAPQGIFVTYSTKGIVKRTLRELGLFVKRLPGPPGKRDMLFCLKKMEKSHEK